jgi:hypothetical protein
VKSRELPSECQFALEFLKTAIPARYSQSQAPVVSSIESVLVLEGNFRLVWRHRQGGRGGSLVCFSHVHLTRLDHCTQHHFMALSTLNPPLPALEDLITLTPRPAKKKIGPRLTRDIRRDILLLRELNDYEDEAEYTYERIAELLLTRYRRTITQHLI